MNEQMSTFASTVMRQKYSHDLPDGTKETWSDIARRVASNVLGAVNTPEETINEMAALIEDRVFLPAGRYLYASGRGLHQVQNCLLLRAEDSREGWADLMQKATMALMTGAGIGVDYSDVRERGAVITRTGGFATGPISLMQMLNEAGRGIQQGGSRRSAIWAGLKWSHPDVLEFVSLKNWIPEVRALKEKDFNFPATMDGTNVSVQLDDEFFLAYHDANHGRHAHAHAVYWTTIRQMLKTGEPGFSIDTGVNSRETLRNAPVVAWTTIITDAGPKAVGEVVGSPTTVWTGRQWAHDVVFDQTGTDVETVTVKLTGGREITCDPTHPFLVENYVGKGNRRKLVSIDRVPAGHLSEGQVLHTSLPTDRRDSFSLGVYADQYTLGFLYGDGHFRDGHAELSVFAEAKMPCLDFIKLKTRLAYSEAADSRALARLYFNTDRERLGGRCKETFPADMKTDHEYTARAFLAGLFDADGNYDAEQDRVRLGSMHLGFLQDVRRTLEYIGIQAHITQSGTSGFIEGKPCWQLVVASNSVSDFAALIPTIRLQPEDHQSYRPSLIKVLSVAPGPIANVYCADVKVEEHSFMAEGVIISNCTEVTSEDDSDICNLGSINMARITSLEQMQRVVELGTYFLMAGTLYSDVPYPKVDEVRTKNRRLGLGLMGLHEWLLLRGLPYAPSTELAKYMEIYATSGDIANKIADEWGVSRPVKTRAVAPTGTIGIIAETSTGIEPVFCVAYKRRYAKGNVWNYQYVIDPTAKRLIDSGVHPDTIEDAYSLAVDGGEKRVQFQVWLQGYVDHSISSTINLPAWGSELNNDSRVQSFGKMLIKYLPNMRGITVYPDGARNGQPLNPVKYSTAIKHVGEVFVEAMDICDLTKGGSCGS